VTSNQSIYYQVLQYFRHLPTKFHVLILISLGLILKLPSHLRLGLPNALSPVGTTAKILKALLPSPILTT
jgi:hypothetical protein